MLRNLLFAVLSLFIVYNIQAQQCTTSPVSLSCPNDCTYSYENPNNPTINFNSSGNYCFTGSGQLSNLTINNGTIIICGTISMGIQNFGNNAKIYITAGSTLTLTNGFNMNGQIINYGTVICSNYGGTTFSISGRLYNAVASSAFTATGNMEFNGNSKVVNNGHLAADYLYMQGNSLCFGASSTAVFRQFDNNGSNISVPLGMACISVTEAFNQYNGKLASTSDLMLCMYPGATINGATGSATVINNCSGCSEALPVEFLDFDATFTDGTVILDWSTASENNSSYFRILRSEDGHHFTAIDSVAAAGNSSVQLDYQYIDEHPYRGISYYQLQEVDLDYSSLFTAVDMVYNASLRSVSVFPNPVEQRLNLALMSSRENDIKIEIFNAIGKNMLEFRDNVYRGMTVLSHDISVLQPGLYYLLIIAEGEDEPIKTSFIHE